MHYVVKHLGFFLKTHLEPGECVNVEPTASAGRHTRDIARATRYPTQERAQAAARNEATYHVRYPYKVIKIGETK